MSSLNKPVLDIEYVRGRFPALKNGFVFMDNAGGSQTLDSVISKISEYLIHYDVQLGASYEISKSAGEKLDQTVKELATLINAQRHEEVVVGPSTSMLLRIISLTLSKQWQPGDEIIVSNSDHEANVSCWTDLRDQGFDVKIWKVNSKTLQFEIEDLKNLITKQTKLVSVVHASNILGTINPIKDYAKVVHEAGALFCVDGVAYAPHRVLDMQEWDVDFYTFSTYKVYGPHLGIMYGKYDLLKKMDGFNHYFITKDDVPYKFQPGNINYELTYSLNGVMEYLKDLYNHHYTDGNAKSNREIYKASFDLIADHEEKIANHLLDYLKKNPKIQIVGFPTGNKDDRVPTISFIHKDYISSDVVEKVDDYRIGIRFGDFYAKKIIHDLDLEEKDGVIRVSMVHYNSIDEVDALIKAFEDIFD